MYKLPKSLADVNTSKPGFYDDPRFIELEQQDPDTLNEYARFVRGQAYTAQYLSDARAKITNTARFIYDRLVKDGRLGACVDASMVLSRFLERQGIWNYVTKGALTISFDPKSGFGPRYLSPIMGPENPAVAGHAWVYAPPFEIVDITVSRQPYKSSESALIGGPIFADNTTVASADVNDLMDGDAIDIFVSQARRRPTMTDIDQHIDPGILRRIKEFGAREFSRGACRFKYVACAMGAPDLPLEKAANLVLSNKKPIDLWNDFSATLTAG